MKLLGIDWGKNRVGIALSDKKWNIVTPYKVIVNDDKIFNKLKNIIDEYEISRLVMGLPLSIYENKIDKNWPGFNFFEKLKRKINKPISWIDEKFSSDIAFNRLSDSGMKYSRKRKKIDKASACIILERFIDKKQNSQNVIIGISGNIGTGKTFIAKKFRKKYGGKIISTDEISRNLTKKNNKGYKNVVKEFGEKILNTNKEINRKKLGKIVFNNKKKLHRLNKILHPLIVEKAVSKIENYKNEIVYLEIPLLIENKLYYLYDYSFLTKASKDVIISRVRNRDQVKSEYVKKVMKRQNTSRDKENMFDYIIDTDNGWSGIRDKVYHIGNQIINFKNFLNRR
ncbi:MAG: dephospho-CoA kinase [Candidatus Mcinerneyibacterium aminivorans]|uniref:Multifunctional fusion protein n=1 Tax=Candidatus Mcinerneyibacterium aminivorans TaxID=2703815 RepID=A0A5D0MGM1_9BACT|nr:MAG: dephospho-CoA kinase [Candidatus Mcinerneyibacterium aminivorans]